MSCEIAYSFLETMFIIAGSLVINGLIAAIIVQYILRLIYKNVVDVPLLPSVKDLYHSPTPVERKAPPGFTPTKPEEWVHAPSRGVVEELTDDDMYEVRT